MKHNSNSLVILSASALMSVVSVAAIAAESKIAILDTQQVLISVEPGKKARAELQTEMEARTKSIKAEESIFEQKRQKYSEKSSVLSAEERQKQEAELQKQYIKIETLRQQLPADLRKKEEGLTVPIFNNTKTVVAEHARKNHYSVVLDKNAVLYSADDVKDITKDVITAYDKEAKAGSFVKN